MYSRKDNGPFNIYAETETIIEFYSLDPMQVVWHGNYIKYFELGRRSLLEKIGYSYNEMKDSGFSFPVVEITVKYIKPLKFKDKIRIKAILIEYENCLRIKYEIYNDETGTAVTRGLSTQMAYDIKTDESCFVCPEVLIKKVQYLINEQESE
ncbi:MAG: acyl-CoA thioesterase [Treponema sp.]|nr:acyl-CoA thioesterase [Treponema sp.]